jgi:hypothetical protein
MTLSISELGKRFWQGKTTGKSARTKIIDRGDNTYLVDYDWAILGSRNKQTGNVTYYSGWYGYSRSTSSHINQSDLHRAPTRKDEQYKLSQVPYPKTVVEKFREDYNDVFFDPFENRWKLQRR